MELSIAVDEKVSEVPGATVPVLVTVRVGFAGDAESISALLRQVSVRTGNWDLAARDEWAGDSKHLRGRERDIERLGDGGATVDDVQDRLVTSLDGQDRSRRSEQHGVGHQVRGTEVGTDTNVLNHTRGGSHGSYIDQYGREVELAAANGHVAK